MDFIYTNRNDQRFIFFENKHQIPLQSIEVMDIMGRTVYGSNQVEKSITLNLAKGTYIVRLMSNNAVLNTKVVIR